jgi:hypothetical protein
MLTSSVFMPLLSIRSDRANESGTNYNKNLSAEYGNSPK